MGALDTARGGLGGHAFGQGAIGGGAIPRPGGSPLVFTLPAPRSYRGRVGAAIPSGGIVLPEARGMVDSNGDALTAPFTYSIANLPTGLTFIAATRRITGSPTAAHATREVTYTASDSSTPAKTTTATFQFPVVSSTATTTLDDWDFRGYGLSTRATVMLALLVSGNDVNAGDVTTEVWSVPPRGSVGAVAPPSVIGDVGIPRDGMDRAVITRIRLHPSTDRMTLNHSASGFAFSDWRTALVGTRSFWLQHRAREDEFPVADASSIGGGFMRLDGDDTQLQPLLDTGQRFIFAMTDTT